MEKNMRTKQEIRKQVLKKRAELPAEVWKAKSEVLMQKVLAHPLYQHADIIYGYLSYNREVDTWELLSRALQDGKKVAVPKVQGKEMEFYYIENLKDVEPGTKGIYEPKGDASRLACEESALILMPLVGFDQYHNRLGYGGGYYDRYLQKHPAHSTMGLAFSLQETEPIPTEPTDRRPDVILTEEKR